MGLQFRTTTDPVNGDARYTLPVRVVHEISPAHLLNILMWHGDTLYQCSLHLGDPLWLPELNRRQVLHVIRNAVGLQERLRMWPHQLQATVTSTLMGLPEEVSARIVAWAMDTALGCFPELQGHPLLNLAQEARL